MSRFDIATRRGYGQFLLAQARALGPVERALEAAGVARALPDWPDRSRRRALAADLDALGLVTPAPVAQPDCPGPAAMWGMAYVLEGSRLGARVLLPRARGGDATARVSPDMPADGTQDATAFLRHGAGADLWRPFLAALESSPYPRADPGGAVAGATAAFAAFEEAALADPE